MKKLFLLTAFLAAIFCVACSNNGGDGKEPEAISNANISQSQVGEGSTSVTLSITSKSGVSYTAQVKEGKDWCTFANGKTLAMGVIEGDVVNLTVNVDKNTTTASRTAKIWVGLDSGETFDISLEQDSSSESGGSNDDDDDDGTEDDGRITIAQAKVAEQNTEVKIKKSTVVAISTKSYLLYDGSDYILVYKNDTPEFSVGDRVEVEATVTEYGGVVQLQYPSAAKVGYNASFEHPTAKEFSGADADAFLSNPHIEYVKLRGTLNKSNSYYNVAFADSSSAMVSLAYPSSEMCPSSYDGRVLDIYGYTIYATKNQYAYVIATQITPVEGGSDDSGDSGDDDGGDSGDGDNIGEGESTFYRDWAELPLCNDRGSNFQYVSHNYTVDSKSYRNFTLCFDKANKAAIWVAYPLHSCHISKGNRTEAWAYDPKIATQYQPNLGSSYNGNYDRGHQLPSGSRNKNKQMNYATFYFSNMTPQASQFNQGVWNNLEQGVRNNVCSDTLYVVTGALFKGNNDSSIQASTTDKDGATCPIPSHYFKVLLRTKSGNTGKAIKNITSASDVKAIAILMKHKSSSTLQSSDFVSIEYLEEFSGITFFPALNDAIEAEVKKQNKRSDWDL